MAKENRFEVVYTQDVGFMGAVRILRDTQTGVEYLFTWYGNAGGLTPLLEADGAPVVRHD